MASGLNTAQLNPEQLRAVQHKDGPALILAGAGSGKTRVLTERISYLIQNHGVNPSEILAVTFTNKAAQEMKNRILRKLAQTPHWGQTHLHDRLWMSTFHSACLRVLRNDIGMLGYQNNFTIYDDSDQLALIKRCCKQLNIDPLWLAPQYLQRRLNQMKNHGLTTTAVSVPFKPEFLLQNQVFRGPQAAAITDLCLLYEKELLHANAVDFGDILYLTNFLLHADGAVLERYRKQFPYILVDEYQDTNRCQYQILKILAWKHRNLCAVGDENQSIYKWRGADISNILTFPKDFPEAIIYKLEQNYRSTKTIIGAATAMIRHNQNRMDKTLWTDNAQGEAILMERCSNEQMESARAVRLVEIPLERGVPPTEIALIYRTNAQSRLLEDRLRAGRIPYQIYGGLKFYDRAEIKDLVAYMRFLVNPHDNVSFLRIINTPVRGIGATTVAWLQEFATTQGRQLYEALSLWLETPLLGAPQKKFTKKTQQALEQFHAFTETLRPMVQQDAVSVVLHTLLEKSGYQKALEAQKTIEAESQRENIEELKHSVLEFEAAYEERTQLTPTVSAFLEEIALVSDLDKKDAQTPSVRLMTAHMAKGLEFRYVIVVGLEESLFPKWNSIEEQSNWEHIEEERRLFYVAMTRAKENLSLLWAGMRTSYGGRVVDRFPSRFMDEIPPFFRNEGGTNRKKNRATLNEEDAQGRRVFSWVSDS